MKMGNCRLQGKVALVTGAGSGMGYAIAELFGQQGAKVAALARRDVALENLGALSNVLPIRADVTSSEDIRRAFDLCESQLGPVDIVCNAAGIHDNLYPLHETSDELWERVIATDLNAPFVICRQAIEGMMERQRGVILNISSVAAYRGLHGPSYSAAKAGVIGMSLSIATRYFAQGIRCNVIAPGSTKTNISSTSGGVLHEEGYNFIKEIAPNLFSREGGPDDIAYTALFLCSDEAKHVNGVVLPVDGGFSAA